MTVESTDAHSARLVAGEACDRTDLKITVPERINIRIKGQTLNVNFQKKVLIAVKIDKNDLTGAVIADNGESVYFVYGWCGYYG